MGMRHSVVVTGANDATKQVSVNAWNNDHVITDYLEFPGYSVGNNIAAPAAGSVRAFSRVLAGREMLGFVDSDGYDAIMQSFFGQTRVHIAAPVPGTAAPTIVGFPSITGTGTNNAGTLNTTNFYQSLPRSEYAATAQSNAVAGFRCTAAYIMRGNAANVGGFFLVARVGITAGATNGTRRFFTGLGSSTASPTDVQPSSQTNIIGAGFDAADTNWQLMFNDGTGTATKVDTGIVRPSLNLTDVMEVAIHCPSQGTTVTVQVTNLTTGATYVGSSSVDLPTNTTMLTPRGYVSAGGTSSAQTFALFNLYCEMDF